MSEQKKIYRNSKDGKVLGVCAGIADYTDIDVVVIRLAILAVIIFSGIVPGIIFYLLAAFVMPEKEDNG